MCIAFMRLACSLPIVTLVACVGDVLEDGRYTGAITAEGCISGRPFSIDVIGGQASFSSYAICHVNQATSDGFDYDCTVGGGEAIYACSFNHQDVHRTTDVVHASIVGANTIAGTISHSEATYSPPDCFVATRQCSDTGTFELVLQK